MGEKETMTAAAMQSNPLYAQPGMAGEMPATREAGSGMATGRVKPELYVEEAPRDVATGQSSGKTMAHDDWQTQDSVKAPRDVATGQSSGRAANIGSSGQDGVGIDDASAGPNLGSSGQERSGMSGAQSNPMYQEGGMSGTNPMYEAGRVATGDLDGDGAAEAAIPGDPIPDIDVAAARGTWDIKKNDGR